MSAELLPCISTHLHGRQARNGSSRPSTGQAFLCLGGQPAGRASYPSFVTEWFLYDDDGNETEVKVEVEYCIEPGEAETWDSPGFSDQIDHLAVRRADTGEELPLSDEDREYAVDLVWQDHESRIDDAALELALSALE